MWPLFIGIGIYALISEIFSDDESKGNDTNVKRHRDEKKVFISFAMEDKRYRDFLVSQAKNEKSPFSFVDRSVKEPWEEKTWKAKCREKISKCDGMIVLLSKNTWHSSGSRWEIKCAKEQGIPVVGMHIKKNEPGKKPPELQGKKVFDWTWPNLDKSIKKF